MEFGGGTAIDGAGTERGDGEETGLGDVVGQGVAGHAEVGFGEAVDLVGGGAALGEHTVVLGDQEGEGAAGGAIAGGVDVDFEQGLDLLLAAAAGGGVVGPVGVEAEEDRVTVGEEGADGGVGTVEADVLALVVAQDEVKLGAVVVEAEAQGGFGEGGGGGEPASSPAMVSAR